MNPARNQKIKLIKVSVQFNISITKEILRQSKNCGSQAPENGSHCAIALALKDIFPEVFVSAHCLFPFGNTSDEKSRICIPLPVVARQFIKLFDGFYLTPSLRLLLPEFDFAIEIPDEVIDRINIDDLTCLISHPILESARQKKGNTAAVLK